MRSLNCAAVVFHSLGNMTLLYNLPRKKKVIWLGWGFDYYDTLLSAAFPNGFLLNKTYELERVRPKDGVIEGALERLLLICKTVLGGHRPYCKKMLSRIDYFSPVIDVEYQMARDLNPWFRPKYISWNYGSVEEDLLSDGMDNIPLGENIIVGNSATPENNHLDVFDFLERCVDLEERRIIVPLSYGDEWYRDKVISAGQQMFGKRFIPLTGFLEKKRYIDMLQGCGYVFMGHIRQQALGNIYIMMLKGGRIFMKSSSPLYQWLTGHGAVIQSIDAAQAICSSQKSVLVPLSETEKMSNAEIVFNQLSRDVKLRKTHELVDVAFGFVEEGKK